MTRQRTKQHYTPGAKLFAQQCRRIIANYSAAHPPALKISGVINQKTLATAVWSTIGQGCLHPAHLNAPSGNVFSPAMNSPSLPGVRFQHTFAPSGNCQFSAPKVLTSQNNGCIIRTCVLEYRQAVALRYCSAGSKLKPANGCRRVNWLRKLVCQRILSTASMQAQPATWTWKRLLACV